MLLQSHQDFYAVKKFTCDTALRATFQLHFKEKWVFGQECPKSKRYNFRQKAKNGVREPFCVTPVHYCSSDMIDLIFLWTKIMMKRIFPFWSPLCLNCSRTLNPKRPTQVTQREIKFCTAIESIGWILYTAPGWFGRTSGRASGRTSGWSPWTSGQTPAGRPAGRSTLAAPVSFLFLIHQMISY